MRSSASSPSLDLCPPSSLGVLTRALLVQPRRGGGACQLREKVLAEAATHFIIVADSRKDSKILGHAWKQGVPIEVAPFAWAKVFVSASRSLARSSSPRRPCDEMLIADVGRVRRPAEDGLREPGAAHGQDEGRPGRHRQRVRPPLSPSLLSLESSTLTHSLTCSNFVIDAVFSESYMRDPAELLHRIKMCVLPLLLSCALSLSKALSLMPSDRPQAHGRPRGRPLRRHGRGGVLWLPGRHSAREVAGRCVPSLPSHSSSLCISTSPS